MASTLDTAKLAKVRALMDSGATEGERAAARRKAEAIAKAAGMTLDAVLSMLDAHPELSDREIARRLSVSSQTVNTWRKKVRAKEAS